MYLTLYFPLFDTLNLQSSFMLLLCLLILAKTYHEQIQIKDNSLGNSYEKLFSGFLDESVTQIIIQDPYIRAFHQVSISFRSLFYFSN